MTERRQQLDNETIVGFKRNQEKQRQRQRELDLKAILGTPDGRRFFFDLIDNRCGVSSGSFVVGSGGHMTSLNEGRRAVGVELINDAQRVAPELYVQALAEALTDRMTEQKTTAAVETQKTETDHAE